MLDHMPEWLGRALGSVRAGHDKLAIARTAAPASDLVLTSPVFADGATLPVWCTNDGEGAPPPLAWPGGPDAAAWALIVEDADSPTPEPIVHAIAWSLPRGERTLARGALAGGGPVAVGRNSSGRPGWLPPDPPTGHGPHDYVFQLFALGEPLPLNPSPGRGAVLDALDGRVLAAAALIGRYERAG